MKQLLIITFSIILLFSCGSKSDQPQESTKSEDAFALEKANFFNSLKTQKEAAKLLPGITHFDAGMLNDPEQFYLYTDNQVIAAANLGVYISDLNYCILLSQETQIKNYFISVFELSKAIQIEKGILEFLMMRYDKNIELHDSMRVVLDQLLDESTLKLQGTDHERLAGIAMAGYQLENLHLALSTLTSLPGNPTEEQAQTKKLLLQYILEQREKIDIIYNFVRVNADPSDPDKNPNYPFYDSALRELIVVYRDVSEENPQGNELKEKVDAIRNKIVNL